MKSLIKEDNYNNTNGADLNVQNEKNITIKESIELFGNHLIMIGKAKSTAIAYTGDINKFYNYIKENFNNRCYVANLTISDINHFQHFILKLGYKENTIDRKFDSLKVYFKYLKDYQFVEKNLLENFHFFRKKNSITDKDNYPNVLEWDDINLIVNSARAQLSNRTYRDIAILELLKSTGCRRDTVLTLKWSDISFMRNEITLIHKKTKNKTTVKMSPSLSEALKDLYNENTHKEFYVFVSQKGNQLGKDAFNRLIRKYVNLSGVKKSFTITSRTFRHSFITHLVRNDVPLIKIAMYTGHKDLDTLKIYTHLVASDTSDISTLL